MTEPSDVSPNRPRLKELADEVMRLTQLNEDLNATVIKLAHERDHLRKLNEDIAHERADLQDLVQWLLEWIDRDMFGWTRWRLEREVEGQLHALQRNIRE